MRRISVGWWLPMVGVGCFSPDVSVDLQEQGEVGREVEEANRADSSLVVMTDAGPVEGSAGELTESWLGIPFAAPPVGELRWKAPREVNPWTEVRQAQAFAQPCSQTDNQGGVQGGEDCLYLNVWRPLEPSSSPRPIMVWIHGGGNEVGATSDFVYNGSKIAAAGDVVVVSITYRLGPLGWFLSDSLSSGDGLDDSGNYGLLDIMAALRWVQNNGAAFGGDEDNITVFGESAGGMDIWAMLLSPLAEGLFHKAIIQSGYPQRITRPHAEEISTRVVEALVVADGLATEENAPAFVAAQDSVWIREYLRGQSTADLITAGGEATVPFVDFYAIEDGVVQPADIHGALARGEYMRVPTLHGSNRDEMKTFLFPFSLMHRRMLNNAWEGIFGDSADEVAILYARTAYNPPTCYNSFADSMGFTLELYGAVYGASLMAEDTPTWVYQFRFDGLVPPFDYAVGAGHGLELPILFNNVHEEFYPPENAEVRATLTRQMQEYWTCFAHSGDPSGCGGDVPVWLPYRRGGSEPYQRLMLDERISLEFLRVYEVDRVNFWLEYYGWALPPMFL